MEKRDSTLTRVTCRVSHQLQARGPQANKDPLLWKFIISPEFGERADLQRLTRELMLRVNEDLGGSSNT